MNKFAYELGASAAKQANVAAYFPRLKGVLSKLYANTAPAVRFIGSSTGVLRNPAYVDINNSLAAAARRAASKGDLGHADLADKLMNASRFFRRQELVDRASRLALSAVGGNSLLHLFNSGTPASNAPGDSLK